MKTGKKLLLVLVVMSWCVSRSDADGVACFDLNGKWQVSKEGGGENIEAMVPGCIHTDLLAAKKIPDPFYRDNEKNVQWVSDASWVYRRSFDVSSDVLAREHVLLRCEGLDTLATIRINDSEVGKTDNMFRMYEFDVKKILKAGVNTIEVKFDSVLPFIRAKEVARKLPTWAYPGAAYIRKEPCNFGWDWGPTLITCGIWKNIGIVSFDTARLDDVLIRQDHSQQGKVVLNVNVVAGPAVNANLTIKTSVEIDSKEVASATTGLNAGKGVTSLEVANPKLWWPAGMGAQPLYNVRVDLLDNNGKLLDSSVKRIGLRTMKAVEQTKDTTMHFVVNGVKFFSKGANWIPSDCFANRATKDILRRYVEDAVAANMNSLRFWGGGYYEEDALFDACDELGVCIWMDFKFSCTTYPSFDDGFIENVKLEARDNLKRLRHHPSIAVWCGNNEIMFFRDKEWSEKKMSEGDYYKLFRDALGGQMKEFAPQADYVTGSPDCGDVHFWKVWHEGKPFEEYRNIHGFVSEFGFQSFPEPKTVQTFTEQSDRESVYSYVMKYHERSNRMYMDVKEDGKIGTDKIMILVKQYFKDPKDFDSTLWLSQITHGYGIKYGAEGWRREMPKSMGCVYWQYNDTWPGSSWASVDYFGRWKALHYMAKRFYAPVLVSGAEDVKAGKVDIFVTSDRMETCKGKLTWFVTDVAGKQIKNGALDVDVPAHESKMVHSLAMQDDIQKAGAKNLIAWLRLDIDGKTVSDNMVTFVYPRELDLCDPELSADVKEKDGRFAVTLKAERPALWAWVELEGLDARCSDNFVHVAKGMPVTINMSPKAPITKKAFRKALKVRSVYDTSAH